jgi:hypothetical protein
VVAPVDVGFGGEEEEGAALGRRGRMNGDWCARVYVGCFEGEAEAVGG